MDGAPLMKCAHCTFVKERLDIEATYDSELIARQIAASGAGHRRFCSRTR